MRSSKNTGISLRFFSVFAILLSCRDLENKNQICTFTQEGVYCVCVCVYIPIGWHKHAQCTHKPYDSIDSLKFKFESTFRLKFIYYVRVFSWLPRQNIELRYLFIACCVYFCTPLKCYDRRAHCASLLRLFRNKYRCVLCTARFWQVLR